MKNCRAIAAVFVLLASFLPGVASAAGPDAVAVFIQGYGSRSDQDGFSMVKGRLRALGWDDAQMVPFSYTGMDYFPTPRGPSWISLPYDCKATQQGLQQADGRLSALLRQIVATRPGARIVLVGHSFGGLLAWWHTAGVVGGQHPFDVDGVVAVDAPMLGISVVRQSFLEFRSGCPLFGSASTFDMGQMRVLWNQDPGAWPTVYNLARQRGIGMWTFGSATDCVYNPRLCGIPGVWADDTGAQIVPGVGEMIMPVAAPQSLSQSHEALLTDGYAVDMIAGLVDLQGRPH